MFHDKLADLVAAGKEDEAQEYLSEHLQRLPEDLKNEILGLLFMDAIVQEAQEIESIASLQEQAISTIEVLEAVKKRIQEGRGETESTA